MSGAWLNERRAPKRATHSSTCPTTTRSNDTCNMQVHRSKQAANGLGANSSRVGGPVQ